MIVDGRTLPPDTVLPADVCIAGAGAAGITLARDLIGSGLRVVVLESGGFEFEEPTQDLYRGTSSGLGYSGLRECRLRYFGGTTNHWTGVCRPLDPEDLETWPISTATLAPYSARARETVLVPPEPSPQEVSELTGLPLAPTDPTRFRSVVYQLSPPARFGTLYRTALEQAENILVYLHTNLTEILLDDEGTRVSAYRGAVLDGSSFIVNATHYVLGLGAIENARMLLASNRQAEGGVGNRNGLVGRYFMVHPHLVGGAVLVAEEHADLRLYTGSHAAGSANVVLGLGPSPQLRNTAGLPNLACTIQPINDVRPSELITWEIANLLRGSGYQVYRFFIRAESIPSAESRVTLNPETDRLGIPTVNLNWALASQDMPGIARSMVMMAGELGRIGLGRLWVPRDENGALDPPDLAGGCHHMGTTRMSASPMDGVVDEQCRVHGLENLFVAGSSVFPSVGFANPTLTLVALAHRLADHLRGLP